MAPPKRLERDQPLEGIRILLVEDEFLIALHVAEVLQEAGATVVGPAATVDEGLMVARRERPNCALLDFQLGRETSATVADALEAWNIPFAFFTGQEPRPLKARWPQCEVVPKPATPEHVLCGVMRLKARAMRAGC